MMMFLTLEISNTCQIDEFLFFQLLIFSENQNFTYGENFNLSIEFIDFLSDYWILFWILFYGWKIFII